MNGVIKEELRDLYYDIDSQERFYQEIIDEAKQWYVLHCAGSGCCTNWYRFLVFNIPGDSTNLSMPTQTS